MIVGKIVLLLFLGVILLIPALILLVLFVSQVVIRIIIKLFGVHGVAPPFLGPFLDSDLRRAFQPPAVIIERSGIAEGMKVLEVGCGSGAYTTAVARRIGPRGREYALDLQGEMLEQLAAKLRRDENRDIRNVTLVKSNVLSMPFENDFFDLVFLVSVLQQISDRQKALLEIRRVLKPGGKLAVTEIIMDPYYSFRSTTVREGLAAGFSVERIFGNAGHYTVRFVKEKASA